MGNYNKFSKVIAKIVQETGNTETPGSTEVTVLSKDGSGNVVSARGTTVPGDEAGYAVGATFVKTDAGDGTHGLYVNIGTAASADFDQLGVVDSNDIQDGTIDTQDFQNNALKPSKAGTDATGESFVFVKEFEGENILPLLDGNTNDLWEVPANTSVVDVLIVTENAAGGAGTVNIGVDDQWDNSSTDVDGFIAAHDLNAPGPTRMSLKDEANQTALAAGMSTQEGQTGSLTITASGDLSGSTWEGFIAVIYYKIASGA